MEPRTPPVPVEWPHVWQDARLSRLLEGTPWNCILLPDSASPELEAALRQRFPVLRQPRWQRLEEIDWRSPGGRILIGDAVWPGAGAAAGDATEAGPTGLPWLDANGWRIRLAHDLAPQAEVWIRSDPPEEAGRADLGLLLLAQSEAWAHGARRPLWLPAEVAAGIARDNEAALQWWRRLSRDAAWWASRADQAGWRTAARLLVISRFAGPDAEAAAELLNLAARRNLPWRASLPETAAGALDGMAAAVYVDQELPGEALLERFRQFVSNGGMLLCLPQAVRGWRGLADAGQPHPRFDVRKLGHGRVALSRSGWDDPYLLAQDAHLLMSRRNDIVRLFNSGSILVWPVVSPDRRQLFVHLISYTRRSAAHDVVVQVWRPVQAAWIESPERPRQAAALRREAGGWEIPLEPFEHYCAVMLEGKWDD